MDLTEVIGYFSALFIGILLGLVGGGGSILTVPVLVYFFGINPVLATAYSLFVVGVSGLVGAVKNVQKGLVSYKTAAVFTVPSFLAVFLARFYIIPAVPAVLWTSGNFVLTKSMGIMILFGIVMFLTSLSMLRSENNKDLRVQTDNVTLFNYPLILLTGTLVGLLTGIIGAGGGFLIIPALVLLVKLSMKVAVGTSLMIIAAKSLIGFMGDIGAGQPIAWDFLLVFTAIAAAGIFIGAYLSNFISGNRLKVSFGWFILLMAVYIITKEILLPL